MNLPIYFQSLSLTDIERFVAENREEDLHLDFKLVKDAGLTQREDRKNFAAAVSGFANSDGGLIIWGVDARKNGNAEDLDCACDMPGISDLKRFVTRLNELTGSVTNPTVEGVDHKSIAIPTETNRGFVATLVPRSDSGPHMAKLGEDRYYRRSGSAFVKMEHFEVADMFGRRPQPKLSLFHKRRGYNKWPPNLWRVQVELGIENRGRGSARAPCLSFRLKPPFGIDDYGVDGNYNHGLPKLLNARDRTARFGGSGDTLVHPGTALPVTVIVAHFSETTEPPDLVLEYEISSADIPPFKDTLLLRGKELLDVD
jgi:Putative DNA-binding domain